MMALIMTMKNKPQAVMMSFQKEYAERYDWLVTLFKDWAFTFMSSFLYYQDFDMLDDMQKQLYRQGMATFGGIAPTYHIELLERPTIVWDFHSLLLGVQMMFSFMLTDEKSSLKVCKHCGNAFVAVDGIGEIVGYGGQLHCAASAAVKGIGGRSVELPCACKCVRAAGAAFCQQYNANDDYRRCGDRTTKHHTALRLFFLLFSDSLYRSI